MRPCQLRASRQAADSAKPQVAGKDTFAIDILVLHAIVRGSFAVAAFPCGLITLSTDTLIRSTAFPCNPAPHARRIDCRSLVRFDVRFVPDQRADVRAVAARSSTLANGSGHGLIADWAHDGLLWDAAGPPHRNDGPA